MRDPISRWKAQQFYQQAKAEDRQQTERQAQMAAPVQTDQTSPAGSMFATGGRRRRPMRVFIVLLLLAAVVAGAVLLIRSDQLHKWFGSISGTAQVSGTWNAKETTT
jgi:hypothetical protein